MSRDEERGQYRHAHHVRKEHERLAIQAVRQDAPSGGMKKTGIKTAVKAAVSPSDQ